MKRFFIAVGLPGCGKTTEFKRRAEAPDSTYIDGDSFDNLDALLAYCNNLPDYLNIYIDGLFLTRQTQDRLRVRLNSSSVFIYWTVDRTASLFNDALRDRPEGNAAITIKNAQIYKPNHSEIIMTKTYDSYQQILEVLVPRCPDTFYSEKWSNGGTWCDCWDNSGTISPQDPLPKSNVFDSNRKSKTFNTLIKQLCTSEDFILDNCEFREEDCGEGDYYGGYEYRSRWALHSYDIVKTVLKDKHIPLYMPKEDIITILPELFI